MYYIENSKGGFDVTDDIMRWREAQKSRTGIKTHLTIDGEPVDVSTVFLGINHNWHGGGRPILYETMIFGGEYDQDCWRYCTRDEAKAGHDSIVDCLNRGKTPVIPYDP